MQVSFVLLAAFALRISHASRLQKNADDSEDSSNEDDIAAPACVIQAETEELSDWIDYAVDHNLDHGCRDYRDSFGWWALRACPSTWQNVAEAVRRGTNLGTGGKSGASVIITPEYVIKTMNEDDKDQFDKLVSRLSSHQDNDTLSYLVPVCRVVKVEGKKNSGGKYLQIMPNAMLNQVYTKGRHLIFDLKGNWEYGARRTKFTDSMMKDSNFHSLFPKGVDVIQARLRGSILTGDDAAKALYDNVMRDTAHLLHLGLMDYSFLVDMVDTCPDRITFSNKESEPLGAMNAGKRLRFTPFEKTRIPLTKAHAGRPIYKNSAGEYLYYWDAFGEWHIGVSYGDNSRGVASHTKAACPNEATEWSVFDHGSSDWVHRPGVQLLGDAGETEANVLQRNPNMPLFWVASPHSGVRYMLTLTIIDMFMHTDGRGFGNSLGTVLTFSSCRPGDIDPIPNPEYRVRFLRMLGYKDPEVKSGNHCGSCLWTFSEVPYTYFSSAYQRSRHESGKCEWGA